MLLLNLTAHRLRSRALTCLALICALVFTGLPVWAEDDEYDSWMLSGDTKIWLEHGISLTNIEHVTLLPAADATDSKKLSPAALQEVTSIIEQRLKKGGLTAASDNQSLLANSIKLKVSVTKFNAGSAADRWIMPGAGATECIIRATILDPESNAVIGEILTWKSVSSGGLFSLGADKTVPKSAAESIASSLVTTVRKTQ